MSFSDGERAKWQSRLESDGYDAKAVSSCIAAIPPNKELSNPMGYIRSMLKDYNNEQTRPSTKSLDTNFYDPAWYVRERLLGSLVMRPPDCNRCGWVHDPGAACAELCWCQDIHPLPNTHVR